MLHPAARQRLSAILLMHKIAAGQPVVIDGPRRLHERCRSSRRTATSPPSASGSLLFAYSCDLSGIPGAASEQWVTGLDVWVLDALRQAPHPSHFSVSDALAWIERIKPKRAILTNMHTDLDYETLRAKLPPHVEPAYDGMRDAKLELGRYRESNSQS